jgi:hypothetical protein
MKIKLSQLRSIIREEASRVLSEARRAPADAPSATCPYVAGAKPTALAVFVKYQGRPEALAQRIVKLDPLTAGPMLSALCCMTDSYAETQDFLVAAGASEEEAQELMDSGVPGDESYAYKTQKPWFEYFASGGKCQHVGGHMKVAAL